MEWNDSIDKRVSVRFIAEKNVILQIEAFKDGEQDWGSEMCFNKKQFDAFVSAVNTANETFKATKPKKRRIMETIQWFDL